MTVADFHKPQFYLKLRSLVQAVKEWRKYIAYSKVIVLTDSKTLYQAV